MAQRRCKYLWEMDYKEEGYSEKVLDKASATQIAFDDARLIPAHPPQLAACQ